MDEVFPDRKQVRERADIAFFLLVHKFKILRRVKLGRMSNSNWYFCVRNLLLVKEKMVFVHNKLFLPAEVLKMYCSCRFTQERLCA